MIKLVYLNSRETSSVINWPAVFMNYHDPEKMFQAFERILEHAIQLNAPIKTIFIRNEKPISLAKSFVSRETKQRSVKMKEIINAHRFSGLKQFKKSLNKNYLNDFESFQQQQFPIPKQMEYNQ